MTDIARASNAAAPWTDLADNRPGQSVRQRADALYAEWRRLPLFRRLLATRSEEHATRHNADSEAYVARQFAKLGDTWRVLHGVPIGDDAVVDHLLVGPGGVFVVDSKHQANKTIWLGGDTLMVDGRRVHHVRDSRHDAALVSELLSAAVGFDVPVTGIVVIVGDKRFDVRHQPSDCAVRVTTPQAAVRWLRKCDVEWTPYGAERIFQMARRSTTWTNPQSPSTVGVLPPAERAQQGHQLGQAKAAS